MFGGALLAAARRAARSWAGSGARRPARRAGALLVYLAARRRRLARGLHAAAAPRRSLAALLPGALLFGVGLLFVNVFNVYVTTRLVEGRADTYGALGIATALLFSLVLVGRLIVVSAELNASLWERSAHHAAKISP